MASAFILYQIIYKEGEMGLGLMQIFYWLDTALDEYYNIRRIEMCEVNSSRVEKPTQETIKLYEEIVVKNFEILKTILPKMNSLYQLNEELERSVSTIESRLIKMENDHENLHYQMRTSHLAVDSKLSSIIAEYNNLSNQTCKFKKQAEFLSREIKETKSKRLILDKSEKDLRNCQVNMAAEKENLDQKNKKIEEIEAAKAPPMQILTKKKKVSVQNQRRSSISLNDEQNQNGQTPKVHFKLASSNVQGSSERVMATLSQTELNTGIVSRKTNLKSSKQIGELSSAKSQKIIKNPNNGQPSQGKSFQKFLKEIENYHFHNQKMKQNYEQLMQEYCKTNQYNFSEIKQKINELTTRLNNLDPKTGSMDTLKVQFSNKIESIQCQIGDKLDRSSFEKIMNDFNTRFFGLHEERKKMANREQTKRALQFLEKKVNSMLNDYYQAKQRSLHHISVDKKGCLRVADIYEERTGKEYKRENIMTQTQANSPRTNRNESAVTSKRQGNSLHSRIANGKLTDNRFNEKQWRPVSTQKGEQLQEPTMRKPERASKVNILKKTSYEILDRDKNRERPKLKKERLIFQYD